MQQNALECILTLALDEDLAIIRDAVFTLANLSDSLELQGDLIREGILRVLSHTCKNDDARVQVEYSTQNLGTSHEKIIFLPRTLTRISYH